VTLQAFQSVLVEAYRDPTRLAPLLRRARLSKAERQVLGGLDRRSLEDFSSSLYAKESQGIQRAFPRTVAFLGERFPAVYMRCRARYEEVRRWPDRLGLFHATARGELQAPEAHEIARFEFTHALLREVAAGVADLPEGDGLGLIALQAGELTIRGERIAFSSAHAGRYASPVLRRDRARRRRTGPQSILFFQRRPRAVVEVKVLGDD